MKLKVYLVPHTHWDREWYFTFETSNVLLNNALNDLKHHQNQKWLIDGQWSLLDDYVKWNPEQKQMIQKLLKEKSVTSGPLYSQPDVFNSQAETIFRNFEVGKKVADSFGIEQEKTAYLPDTFGFGQNIPQIFNLSGIKNFVFWRGLGEEQLKKGDHFIWKGPNNSKLKSFVLRKGYFALGMYYPYNDGKIYPEKKDHNVFLTKVENLILSMNVKGEKSIILPLGGDQAPFMINQSSFIKELNLVSKKYEFVLTSSYDDYFKSKIFKNKSFGDLREPITGKIHRTITSSRYDIKKSFRDAEDALYYLLEPLEIFYQQYDKDYYFENFKTENILKPLLIAQTHDSLGGCNTDITNAHQLNRIGRIEENTWAQIDLLLKKIIQMKNIKEENIIIFNPAPFRTSFAEKKIIYSSKNKEINIINDKFSILTIFSENISLNQEKPLYKQEVIIVTHNLPALSFNQFNAAESDSTKIKWKTIKIKNDNNFVFGSRIKFKIKIIKDHGDSYDFSPGKEVKVKFSGLKLKETQVKNINIYLLSGTLNESPFKVFASKINGNINFDVEIDNKFKDTKISLVFEKKTKIKKSLNLALLDFTNKNNTVDWKDKYQEYPAHVDANDGIVSFNGINILTSGTNEIFDRGHSLELTLFRTYGYVTKGNMAWRPSTSGLSWIEKSIDSQLQKKLHFNFGLYVDDSVKSLNTFKYKPYSYKVQSRNFIANKMTKFVINNIINEQNKKIKIECDTNIFISSMRQNSDFILIRGANMINSKIQALFKINGKKYKYDFKPYEIMLIKFKLMDKHE